MLYPKPERRPKRQRDPVDARLRIEVLTRDGDCVAALLGEPDCRGRLTLDHVKDHARMGRRAPSDARHLVTICEHHHLGSGWATSHRPELRAYLEAKG